MARIPEQRISSAASEVKTITEAGPSGGDLTDFPPPDLPPEQRTLLGNAGSHTKWPKPPLEKKAEVRARDRRCLWAPDSPLTADGVGVEAQGALEPGSPPTQLGSLLPVPQENRYVVRLSESNLVI